VASARFTVLTGHLSQYSLADLLGILRHQRKTGRLIIEYIGSPAILFFKDGNLVDAEYNNLIGVQAIFVAFVQPPAAFNFNPLIQPTRDSIDHEQQRVILELLGCWTEDAVVVKSVTSREKVATYDIQQPELLDIEPQLALPHAPPPEPGSLPAARPMLSLPAAPLKRGLSFRSVRRPWVLAMATFVLLLIFGVPTLIAINNKTRKTNALASTTQLQSAVANPTSPSTNEVSSVQLPADASADKTSGTLEQIRTRDQPAQSPTGREQLTNKPPPVETQKNEMQPPAPAVDSTQSKASTTETVEANKTKQPATNGQTVKVVMRIENGRVVQATVGDRRPGAEAYEALALRIARQRRYPAGTSKQETLLMKVDGPK